MFFLAALALALLLQTAALAAAPGYACYREKAFTPTAAAGHAGIVDAVSGTTATYVIQHPGAIIGTVYLQRISLASFKGSSGEYYGEYYIPGTPTATYNNIVSMARALNNRGNVQYVMNSYLMTIYPVNQLGSRILQEDIYAMRCDGLTEYCYEYNNVKLCGGTTVWNISIPSQFSGHGTYLPTTQMGKMTFASKS